MRSAALEPMEKGDIRGFAPGEEKGVNDRKGFNSCLLGAMLLTSGMQVPRAHFKSPRPPLLRGRSREIPFVKGDLGGFLLSQHQEWEAPGADM